LYRNPTNGSWWFIQILSIQKLNSQTNPTNGSWWIVQIGVATNSSSSDLNHPPTAVGGIAMSI